MKKMIIGVLAIVGIPLIINAQQSVLLFTNFPSDLMISEEKTSVEKTPIWIKDKGGYLIDIKSDVKTIITSSSNITFKLSNENKTTKNIQISKGDKISVFNCLNSDEYCCQKLSDKQQSATKKIYAVSLMKKSANINKTVQFNNLTNSFINKTEFNVKWSTDSLIQSISIFDVNSMEEIFNKKISNQINSITYSDIKNNLLSDLSDGGKYVLKIHTRNLQNPIIEIEESSYGFEINTLAFVNKTYYFLTKESVNIEWDTKKTIKEISFYSKPDNIKLWSSVDFTKNNFSINTDIANTKIITGTEYVLKLVLENDNVFSYSFVVLLSEEESEELFKIVE